MKYSNATSLDGFYVTRLGNNLAGKISTYLNMKIKEKSNILIFGYGDPFLSDLKSEDFFYAIPDGYKIARWPKIRPFRTVVIDEMKWPFSVADFDLIVVLNFLEFSKHLRSVAKELCRCLKNNGELVVISFNKREFMEKVRKVRNDPLTLVFALDDEGFNLNQVFCVGANSFHSIKRLPTLMLPAVQMFYDIVIFETSKKVLATEPVLNLQESFGIS